MTTTIITKNSSTASAVPLAADLVQGELAVNVTDKRLYTENASGTVVELGTNPSTVTTTTVNGLTVGKGAGSVATNTAVGASALAANTTGSENTALGVNALAANTSGAVNTAVGGASLLGNTTGGNNIAVGNASLLNNTTGSSNTALGRSALLSNTIASNNTAVGNSAGYSNTTGTANTFVGLNSGYSTTGSYNTFIGSGAATGVGAGFYVTTGAKNTILGSYNGNQGGLDIRTASNYIVLSDGDGNPMLYFIGGSGELRVPTVYSLTTANAANIWVASDGSIRRSTSALKYKQDIRDVEDFDIGALRPVRYKSKSEKDDQTKDHLGLIADEAAEAGFEELVTRGADGEIEGFQYERLTVVLLKKLQTLDAEFKAYVAAHP